MAFKLIEVVSLGGAISPKFSGPSFVASLAVVLVFLATRLSALLSQRKFRAENKCKSPPAFFQRDILFASDMLYESMRAFQDRKYLDMCISRHTQYGHTYSAQALGRQYIFTTDPENLKTILSVRFKDYTLGHRSTIMEPLLGRGIFGADEQEWTHSRALLRPKFVKDHVEDIQMADKHVQALLKLVKLADGKTIDLQPLFSRFAIDAATEFLFSQSTNNLASPNQSEQKFVDAFEYSLSQFAILLRLGPFWRLRPTHPKARAAHHECRTYVDKIVKDAAALAKSPTSHESGRSFLKELVHETNDTVKIRDEILNLLIAGRDTVTSLLSSFFHAVARKPEVWAKIRDEVKQFTGDLTEFEQLRSLRYTKNCLNEALRLWPPVPVNQRRAKVETVLPRGGGKNGDEPVHIPKGGTIIYTVWAMHRRPDLYGDDANEFRPERWENQTYGWQYLPFNGGPRICLGQQFALNEALLVVARFAQEFKAVEPRDSKPWTEELHLTLSSHHGVQVALTPATD